MNSALYILIAVMVVGFAALFYVIIKLQKAAQKPPIEDQSLKVMMEWMKQMKDNTDQTRQEIQKGLDGSSKAINERLDKAAMVISSVTKELGHVQQIGKSFAQFQDFFLSAKKRGNIGEQILEEMIRQSLPPNAYAFQYRFRSSEVVDAIVKLGERILAIDSKFSMENYRAYVSAETDEQRDAMRKLFIRDIKKRIDEISKKYVIPAENTFDFALMYVPADSVFNEIADDVEVYEYARNKHVHLVSPGTFYYFLQVIIIGMQGQRINEQAEHILKTIQGLRSESGKFADNLSVLTKHVTNAKSTLEIIGSSYEKIHNKIEDISTLKIEKQDKEPVKLLDNQ